MKFCDRLKKLLRYVLAEQDAAAAAEKLIDDFLSEQTVLNTPLPNLCAVPGLSRRGAVLLGLTAVLDHRRSRKRPLPDDAVKELPLLKEFCCSTLKASSREMIMVIYLGRENKPSGWDVFSGLKDNILFCRPQLLRQIIRNEAAGIILVHNHPDGCGEFSAEDFESTRYLAVLLKRYHIKFADHWLVSRHGCISMKGVPENSGELFDGDADQLPEFLFSNSSQRA